MENFSDEHIINEIAAGKMDFLKLLFDRYSNQLLNYFFRSTGNLDDSKDLTQEVFFKVLKYAKSCDTSKPFKFWLFSIAGNLLKSYYSKKQKQTVRHKNIIDQQVNPNTVEKQATEDKYLFKAISKLPEEYRELIVLSRFTNLKYSEIAEIFQTTEASIKNKLYRALIKLRNIYFEITKTEGYEV